MDWEAPTVLATVSLEAQEVGLDKVWWSRTQPRASQNRSGSYSLVSLNHVLQGRNGREENEKIALKDICVENKLLCIC